MPVYTKQPNMVFATLQEDLTDDGNETPGLTPTYIRLTEAKTTDFPAEGYILVADDKAKVPGDTVWALYEYTGKADQSGGSTNDSLTNLSRAEAVNRNFSSSHTFTSGEADVVLADSADQLNDLLDIINGNTAFPNGIDLGDNPVNNVSVLTADRVETPTALGIEWNITNDTWTYIDLDGNALGFTPDFTQRAPWNQIRRCNVNAAGEVVAYWGDSDYQHTPTNNDVNVMVEFPRTWVADQYYTKSNGDVVYRAWVANYNASGLSLHPWFNQGDETARHKYLSAYEASAYSDDGGTTWYLASRSGVTPAHGNGDYSGLNGNTLSHFDIEEARQYAQNIGTNWQQNTIWGYGLHRILSMIYLGSMDFQSQVGRGIVDKDSGSGFNGENTGADSIDGQLSEANLGTATGTGSDGYTPVSILWVENPYGNIWTFVDGYEALDSEYRILRRDGEWGNVGPAAWGSSDYETSQASPLTDDDGYIDDIEDEELLRGLLIPASTAGSDSTYIPDYFWSHDSGENNILLSGGRWSHGSGAGLGYLNSVNGVGGSGRLIGARLEFIG